MELKANDKTVRFTFTSTEKGVYIFKYNPLEYLETEYGLRRDGSGLYFTFSGDYSYQKDAYDYLKTGLALYGVLWECYLTIEEQNNFTYEYDTIVSLKKLDFSSIVESDDKAGFLFKISLTDTGFYEKINTRKDEEIPYIRFKTLDGGVITAFSAEFKPVTVYGVEIGNRVIGTGNDYDNTIRVANDTYTLPLTFKSNNDIRSSYFRQWGSASDYKLLDCFYYTEGASKVIMDFDIHWTATGIISLAYVYVDRYINDPATETITFVSNEYTSSIYSGTNLDENTLISLTLDLLINECLLIKFIVFGSLIAPHKLTVYSDSVLDVTAISKYEPSVVQMVSALQVHKRVLEAMTGQSDNFTSSVFETGGKWAHIYFTNGYLSRLFPAYPTVPKIEGEITAQLTFKWSELVENMQRLLNVDYGLITVAGVQKIICEDKSYFYKNSVSTEIDKIERNSFVRELDNKLLYSSVKAGTKKKDYRAIGTLKSYANLCQYSTVLSTFDNELDLETSYFVDPIWMETARRNPKTATETTDSDLDNDIFVMETIIDSLLLVQRQDEDFDTVNGIDEITTPMNLNLSPARCLYRWGAFITIGLQLYLDKLIKFNKSEIKNTLSTKRTDETITISENVDIDPDDLSAPYLTGYKIKALAKVNLKTIGEIEIDPYELIELPNPIDGGVSNIYIDKITNKPINEALSNIEGYESV